MVNVTANEKRGWKVHFNKFLKHIAHDMQKGVFNTKYRWNDVVITTGADLTLPIEVIQNSSTPNYFGYSHLGTETKDYRDNNIANRLINIDNTSTMTQELVNGNNATVTQENETMKESTLNAAMNNAKSTIKTVAQQIQESAITSAKMEAGENILLALRNIVLAKTTLFKRIQFKFAPIALDTAVTLGADVLVAELMPNKKSAKLAVECLNLAMTKEIIHALPITDFTNALTGGSALGKVKDLLRANDED